MISTHYRQSTGRTGAIAATAAASLLFVSMFGIQFAQADITPPLVIGSTGSDVTEVQRYYALDSVIYPSGLVTGYFGPLTSAATERFQTQQSIVSSGTPGTTGFGIVGPRTASRLNALMGNTQPNVSWDTIPVMSPVSLQYNDRNATISWTTNEPTQGQVFYDTTFLRSDESTGPRQSPYVSGSLAADGTGNLQTMHTIVLQNLQPDTTYFYIVRSIDSVGNVTMVWPSTFRTSK
jgi:peptidoglycan hydrolase-like protein with peptidoglycan-binding domain